MYTRLCASKRAARELLRAAIVRLRVLLGDTTRRSLPDYIIIGAQKCGTTSLQKALARHPDVCPSLIKEIHFFDLAYERGEAWYRAHFGLERARERARERGRTLVMGEATPFYLAHPQAAERAARMVPGARLIVLLRDPVERAYSHYAHEVRLGHEQLTFAEALERELAWSANALGASNASPNAWEWQHQSYLHRGLYAAQLRTWMRWFAPEQFLILRSEDYFAQGLTVLDQVCSFLEVRPVSALRRPEALLVHRNRGERRAPLPQELRARLKAYFSQPNQALEELLGRAMAWD